jgi:hypothetical protein
MSTYKALTGVAVAGDPYDEGDTFEATEEQMADAVAAGLVEEVEEKKPRPAATKKAS